MTINKFLLCASVLLITTISFSGCSQEQPRPMTHQNTEQPSKQLISDEALDKFRTATNIPVESVTAAPVDGFVQLTTPAGVLYLSQNGEFVFAGNLFNIAQGMRNETELAMYKVRQSVIASLGDSAIVFKAKNEQYVANVFTDITCGYCRKLHREIQDYLDLGITVRYLAYPRAGVSGQSYRDMVSIWCSENQQQDMTSAKEGNDVSPRTCDNPVAQHFKAGGQIGVSGTPNIVLENGALIGGYVPAETMLQQMKQMLGEAGTE